MKKRFREGFTLIELLVVIAMLALVAAILFPVFSQARVPDRAKSATDNLHKITRAILQYVDDNDDQFPRAGYACQGHDGTNSYTGMSFAPGERNQCGGDDWQDVIGPYVKDPAVFTAPNDKSAVGEGPWGGGMDTNFNASDGNFSLLYNDLLAHKMANKSGSATDPGYADPSKQDPRANGLRIAVIHTPSDCLLLAEGHGGWDKVSTANKDYIVRKDWTGSTDLQNKWHHEYTLNGNFTPFLASQGYDGSKFIRIGLPFSDHGGNVAFVDGHQKFITFETPKGLPMLCKTLPWPKTMDPKQLGADKDSCRDVNNPLPASWTNPNWY